MKLSFALLALALAGCDTAPVSDLTPCVPARVDTNLNLPCATAAHPLPDTYGYDDGLYVQDGVFIVPSCDVCSLVSVVEVSP